jgi:hypothetical protein
MFKGIKKVIAKKLGGKNKVSETIEKLEKEPDSLELQETLEQNIISAKINEDEEIKSLLAQMPASEFNIKAEKIGVVAKKVTINGGINF